MHPSFHMAPCTVGSAVGHLERWTTLCGGQPSCVTSIALRASSDLLFHTLVYSEAAILHAANFCSREM